MHHHIARRIKYYENECKGGIIIVSIIEEIDVKNQWSFIWLMYVNDVDLSKHCKPCLKGYTSRKINKWTRHEENVCLDESEAKYYYLCGGSYPYIWKNNFHLAWKEKSGASFEYSFNGITIRLKNAERVEFSQDDIEKTQKYADRPEYYTCRNWQFANKVKYAIDLEEASEKMNEYKYEEGFDDSEFFEEMKRKSEKYEKEFMEICLNAHEEYLIKMNDEELNEDYRQYLKENNINRECDK